MELFLVLLLFQGALSWVCDDQCNCLNLPSPYRSLTRVIPDAEFSNLVGVKFILMTRDNRVGVAITARSPIPLQNTTFNPALKTYFITHGYLTIRVLQTWQTDMAKALLDREPCNVFVVDWQVGANQPLYPQAVANTLVVGCEIGQLLLREAINPDNVHLIGHSLGAQISSYVSNYVLVKNITGLDPAGPWFTNEDVTVRLDPSDAKFVQAVSTNAGGFGTSNLAGQYNVLFNNGQNQPGCCDSPFILDGLLTGLLVDGNCSHNRAVEYMIAVIQDSRSYWGHSSFSPAFPESLCGVTVKVDTCSCSTCNVFNIDYKQPVSGVKYVKTTPSNPYYFADAASDAAMATCSP